jgi:hypothetical protein
VAGLGPRLDERVFLDDDRFIFHKEIACGPPAWSTS